MYRPDEWGKTMYDDILKKYRIPRKQLYFVLDESDVSRIRRKLKRPIAGIREIKDRYELIKRDVNTKH